MPRSDNPDYYVDPDRGTGSVGHKQAEFVDLDEAQERSADRAGLRDLDARLQATEGLHWATKARQRLYPQNRSAPLAHPRMERQLPAKAELRVPLSGRQRKERSKARHQAQARMPQTQLRAVRQLTSDAQVWGRLGDQLSQHVGDLDAMDPDDAAEVRRIDRAIQSYERHNERGHVVYTDVKLPAWINTADIAAFVRNHFSRGERIEFDRYTVGAHQMHEAMAHADEHSIAFEMQTRRGAYLGQSDRGTDTGHLLPRALTFQVAGITNAEFIRPDGSRGRHLTVQLIDVTPTDEESLQ